jgi:2-keto-4-pentenoate hydratase/2-oxohepta-3-ene-1,7-dioic acid hydratase in catechol pathway
MKIVSFERRGIRSSGGVDGERIVDLTSQGPRSLTAGLREDISAAAAESASTVALADVRLLPPVPGPSKILCVGPDYRAHATEMRRFKGTWPTVFLRHAATLVGPEQPTVDPRQSTQLGFEGEPAVVVGSPTRHVDLDLADEHIAGYTCFNDGSIRDFQSHSSQFTAGKNFPPTGACGTWIVTRDELPGLADHAISTRLNGHVMPQAQLADLIFGVAELIAYLSSWTELTPGDLAVTGTPGEVGAGREPEPLWMRPGDVCEVEIEGIGTLCNPISEEDSYGPGPPSTEALNGP